MKFRGRVRTFGDHINTDLIIPARYINTTDPATLAAHCMEDADPGFVGRIRPGDILVAGENFGCGSSREHAPIAIKAAGIACVVAGSFARIFYRNAFNMGLPIFESKELPGRVADGDEIEVDGEQGLITLPRDGSTLRIGAIPPFMQQLLRDGGLMQHIRRQRRD